MGDLPSRKTVRLKDIDYNEAGAYFVTICTKYRQYLFGRIQDGQMNLNQFGEIAEQEIGITNQLRASSGVQIIRSVVMPNHVHLLIELTDCQLNDVTFVGTQRAVSAEQLRRFRILLKQSIPVIVRAYKAAVTKRIRDIYREAEVSGGHSTLCPYKGKSNDPTDMTIWQSRYYEHVVRGRFDYREIADYIENNPARWETDKLK
ncbi:MAG: transposase [Clostridia bacterium]|nr:transposase [Clostridia bacterium]